MSRILILTLSVLWLSACAHFPWQRKPGLDAAPPVASAPVDLPAHAETAAPAQTDVSHDTPPQVARVLPDVELTEELLYQMLLADIANQRGEAEVAVKITSRLARQTRDPRLAARAAQLAIESGQLDKAVESIRLWREVEANSLMPNYMLISVLLRTGRMDEAQTELHDLLRRDLSNLSGTFMQAYQMLLSASDKSATLKLMRNLSQTYPEVPEGHWAVAQLAHATGDDQAALNAAKVASQLRPDWDRAIALEAALLQQSAPQAGLDKLHTYLLKHPDARELRLQYARALLDQKQFKLSRDEFRRLSQENLDSSELPLAVAMLSFQLRDYQDAEQQLILALGRPGKSQDVIRYYLGQLSEAKHDDAAALGYYEQVQESEYRFSAQVRAAYLLNKRGEMAVAMQRLHAIKPEDNQQRAQLIVMEARMLAHAKQMPEAYKVLQQGLEKLPNHPDLLYETAMVADRIGKALESENLLRKLMQMQPNDPQAYNALGFSLLDRNERITEALGLVEKALQLAPDDPAIIDSVGWGYYRSGRLDESIAMLRRAYAKDDDPEIAAHLGEVLWVSGSRDEAKKIWQESLNEHADNTQLQAVIKKFDP